MNRLQMRIRPGFLWVLLGCFLFSFILLSLLPEPSARKKAAIVITRFEAKQIASALERRATETGGLTNIDNSLVSQAVFGTNNLNRDYYTQRTSSLGEVLDWWKIPYRFEILAQTNFIVRSAGPNKKFGDVDDIIFNSVSNDFVKP